MGIDAEILVRNVPASAVTEEWLTELSWNLCNSIGAKHFFVTDGLREPEYSLADTAWRTAFDTHPLYKEWNCSEHPVKEELRSRMFADIGPPPEQRRLAIDRTLTRYREANYPPPGAEYHQDGEPILAQPWECLLELSLFGRYYAEDYERGDIIVYCAIAEWLELHIPGCHVWYGGDSSGVVAEPFTSQRRLQLRQHLYSASGRQYFDHRGMQEHGRPIPKACSLCPSGLYRGTQHMWGNHERSLGYHCRGCGQTVETHDAGNTWATKKKD